jgi:hypothetical protein
MSTPRRITYQYAKDPDTVAALLHDPEFLRHRAESNGESNIEIKVEATPDGMRVLIARDKEVDLPAFAKKMFTPQNRITEDTRWRRENGQWVADYHVNVAGIPGEVRGRSKLIATPSGGCSYESAFEVTARVPLVGAKLESIVADKLEQTFRTNAERNAERLRS